MKAMIFVALALMLFVTQIYFLQPIWVDGMEWFLLSNVLMMFLFIWTHQTGEAHKDK